MSSFLLLQKTHLASVVIKGATLVAGVALTMLMSRSCGAEILGQFELAMSVLGLVLKIKTVNMYQTNQKKN